MRRDQSAVSAQAVPSSFRSGVQSRLRGEYTGILGKRMVSRPSMSRGRQSYGQRQGGELHEEIKRRKVDGRTIVIGSQATRRDRRFQRGRYNRRRLHSALAYRPPSSSKKPPRSWAAAQRRKIAALQPLLVFVSHAEGGSPRLLACKEQRKNKALFART